MSGLNSLNSQKYLIEKAPEGWKITKTTCLDPGGSHTSKKQDILNVHLLHKYWYIRLKLCGEQDYIDDNI